MDAPSSASTMIAIDHRPAPIQGITMLLDASFGDESESSSGTTWLRIEVEPGEHGHSPVTESSSEILDDGQDETQTAPSRSPDQPRGMAEDRIALLARRQGRGTLDPDEEARLEILTQRIAQLLAPVRQARLEALRAILEDVDASRRDADAVRERWRLR